MSICCKKIYRKNIKVIVLLKKQVKQINKQSNEQTKDKLVSKRKTQITKTKKNKRKKLTNEPFVSTSKRMRRFCLSV